MKNLITQFIRSGLREHRTSHVSGRGRPLPPPAIARQSDKALVPPMSNRQLHGLLEEGDLAATSNTQKV